MRASARVLRVLMVAFLTVLAAMAAPPGQGGLAAASWSFNYLDGLEQAVTRTYYRDASDDEYISVDIEASIARFDSEASATAGYEEVGTQYAIGYAADDPAATPVASEVAGLGEASTAYTSLTHYEMLLEWYLDTTVLLTRDGRDLYLVSVTLQTDQEPPTPVSTGLARDLTTAMLGAEEGGEVVENADGTSSGGLWDKFPTSDDEVLRPYGTFSFYDLQVYPEPEIAEEGTPEADESDEAFDFSTLDGIERAVGRSYAGDTGDAASPDELPPGIYFFFAVVVEFGTEEQASAGMATLQEAVIESVESDGTVTMGSVDGGDLGDETHASFGTIQEEGATYEIALVVVRDGSFVYIANAVGVGVHSGAMDTATGVVRAMAEADAGEGDGTYDESGGSTGGLWDKLPPDGDPVLQGVAVDGDEMLYPVPDEDS